MTYLLLSLGNTIHICHDLGGYGTFTKANGQSHNTFYLKTAVERGMALRSNKL